MKQPINEIKKMQLLAGLITESEYRESQINEAKNIPSILRKWNAEPGDRLDYQTVANMIEVGRIEAAAKFITDELDTSIREMMMDIIEENDPELYKKMFGAEADASKFEKTKELMPSAAAFRVAQGEDYDELAKQFPNLQDPKVKAQVMSQVKNYKYHDSLEEGSVKMGLRDLYDYANSKNLTPTQFENYLKSKNIKYKLTDKDSNEVNFLVKVWNDLGFDDMNYTYSINTKEWEYPYAIRLQAGQGLSKLFGKGKL